MESTLAPLAAETNGGPGGQHRLHNDGIGGVPPGVHRYKGLLLL